MTSDNHVTGPVTEAMRKGAEDFWYGLDHNFGCNGYGKFDEEVWNRDVEAFYLAMKAAEQASDNGRPQGGAGDAIDFAADHCAPDEAIAFLNDWRTDMADEWPGYMKWLAFQRKCAVESKAERAAALRARASLDIDVGEGK